MSLVNTRLVNFRADSPVDKWEVRASQYGMFDCFRNQTNSPNSIITQDLADKAIAAVGSTLQIPVLDAGTFTISNVTQPVTVTGAANTSQVYAVTFVNYQFDFLIWPAQHFNNDIKIQKEFNRHLNGFTFAAMKAWDIAAETALEAKKTQVLADTLGGRYSLASNVVVAPLAEEEAIIGDLDPLAAGNDFFGMMDVVGNQALRSHVRNKLMEKGQYNTENKTYQWDDKTFYWSPEIGNAAGHKATGFAIQKDSIGFVQQFSPDCLMGHRTGDGKVWDVDILPFANVPIGVYQYDGAVDASSISGAATAHLTASKVEAYGFHTAMAFITPYNSSISTIATPIMKFAIATS